MPEWRAKLLEIGVGQLAEDLRVDFGVAEGDFVLAETDAPQPVAHVHDRLHPAQADNRQRAGCCKAKAPGSGRAGRLLARRRRERGPVAGVANLATREARLFFSPLRVYPTCDALK